MAKEIKLSQNKFALVDDEDFNYLNQFRWHYSIPGYAMRHDNGKHIKMHRIIMNPPQEMDVDHKNHNGLDNRRSNLRICSTQQNLRNSKKISKASSNFKGVYKDNKAKKKMWKTNITVNNKVIFIGRFDTEHQAALAYDLWAKDIFKEFAYLNFPSKKFDKIVN